VRPAGKLSMVAALCMLWSCVSVWIVTLGRRAALHPGPACTCGGMSVKPAPCFPSPAPPPAVFPNVKAPPSQTRDAGYSECAMQGLAVKPRKGDAGGAGLLPTGGPIVIRALQCQCSAGLGADQL
jgi:hypothetical protein